MPLLPDIQIDNLTILLLVILVVLLLYVRAKPDPLVHPLLLGKQSDVSQVRKRGETGVYRSWATGQGSPLTVRPANSVKVVKDVIASARPMNPAVPRCILDVSLTDEGLLEILRLLPLGLHSLFPSLSTSSESPRSIITLLPPRPHTSLPLLLLFLASSPSNPVIPLPHPKYLNHALETSCHPSPGVVVVHDSLVEEVLEHVVEDHHASGQEQGVGVLIVGDEGRERKGIVDAARKRGVKVAWWDDIWEAGEKAVDSKVEEPSVGDVHSYFYSEGKGEDHPPVVVKVTHLNATAGISALLSLFPADKRPSVALGDVVASAVPLSTPLGMTIALASLWSGAGFRIIGNAEANWNAGSEPADELEKVADTSSGQPKPTVIFISTKHHTTLLRALHETLFTHPLSSLATRHKVNSIRAGHVDRSSFWDKLVFNRMREGVMGGIAGHRLRAVITVDDSIPLASISHSPLLLSLPFSRLHPSHLSTGPIFVSHFYDLQSPLLRSVHDLSDLDIKEKAHCGPPAANIEVLLKGDGVEIWNGSGNGNGNGNGSGNENVNGGEKAKEKKEMRGRVWVRGPGVLERVDGGKVMNEEWWTDIGEDATVQPNGTFIVGHMA